MSGPDLNDALRADPEAARRRVEEMLARQAKQDHEQANGKETRTRITGFSAAELEGMSFPPIKYIVLGYIPEGLTLLAGKPKLGKSWLMMDAALATAFGGIAFGSIECIRGDVLYLALEDNPRRLQKRLRQLLPHSTWPPRLRIETTWPRLDQGGVDKIEEWCDGAPEPRLVIIDTLGKVRGSRSDKDSAYEADYRAVEELHRLANERGLAIVLVHHVRKMDAEDPLDTVSGTTGLTGAVDTVLVLNRDSNGVTLYGRGRDIEEIETAARFDRETGRWSILGAASEVRRSDERSNILDVLREAEDPMSPADVADAVDMPRNNVKQLLFKMAKAGEVVKLKGRGRYIHPERTDLDNRRNPHNHGNRITDAGDDEDEDPN